MKLIRYFVPQNKRGFAEIKPSKNFIPSWYKKAETFFEDEFGNKNAGLKTCMPYLDSLISGYMLTTPVNIYVNQKENSLDHVFQKNEEDLIIRWDGPPQFNEFIKERPQGSGATMPRPANHYPNHLIFDGFWTIKTPRGYSLLLTPPLNRYDLPFTTSSGIIDSDKYFAPGNIPFFLKKDFSGLIPKNTPIAQIIPIKRNDWSLFENDPYLSEKGMIQGETVRNKQTNYKKGFWQKKRYQ